MTFCTTPHAAKEIYNLDLNREQEKQLNRLYDDIMRTAGRRGMQVRERVLGVLTPLQREKLLAGFANVNEAGPFIRTIEPGTRILRGMDMPFAPPPSFVVLSPGAGSMYVCPELGNEAIRDTIGLTDAQARNSWPSTRISSPKRKESSLSFTYNAGSEKPVEEQRVGLVKLREKLDGLGRSIILRIADALTPEQLAKLKSVRQENDAVAALAGTDRKLRESLGLAPEQKRGCNKSSKIPPSRTCPCTAQRARRRVAILTPEQRKKLEQQLQSNGL